LQLYKTDPTNPDTDGGWVRDGAEIVSRTNPLIRSDDNGSQQDISADDIDTLLHGSATTWWAQWSSRIIDPEYPRLPPRIPVTGASLD
jgi:hypothetical protein